MNFILRESSRNVLLYLEGYLHMVNCVWSDQIRQISRIKIPENFCLYTKTLPLRRFHPSHVNIVSSAGALSGMFRSPLLRFSPNGFAPVKGLSHSHWYIICRQMTKPGTFMLPKLKLCGILF